MFTRASTQERQGWLTMAKRHPSTDKVWIQDGQIEIHRKDGSRVIVGSKEDLQKL